MINSLLSTLHKTAIHPPNHPPPNEQQNPETGEKRVWSGFNHWPLLVQCFQRTGIRKLHDMDLHRVQTVFLDPRRIVFSRIRANGTRGRDSCTKRVSAAQELGIRDAFLCKAMALCVLAFGINDL